MSPERMARQAKDSQFIVRASVAQITLWREAALAAGYRSVSAWVRDTLTRHAQSVVKGVK